MDVKKCVTEMIETVINHYPAEDVKSVETYHVDIVEGDDSIDIHPKNGNTFYGIEDICKILNVFKVSHYVTVDRDNKLYLHAYSFTGSKYNS